MKKANSTLDIYIYDEIERCKSTKLSKIYDGIQVTIQRHLEERQTPPNDLKTVGVPEYCYGDLAVTARHIPISYIDKLVNFLTTLQPTHNRFKMIALSDLPAMTTQVLTSLTRKLYDESFRTAPDEDDEPSYYEWFPLGSHLNTKIVTFTLTSHQPYSDDAEVLTTDSRLLANLASLAAQNVLLAAENSDIAAKIATIYANKIHLNGDNSAYLVAKATADAALAKERAASAGPIAAPSDIFLALLTDNEALLPVYSALAEELGAIASVNNAIANQIITLVNGDDVVGDDNSDDPAVNDPALENGNVVADNGNIAHAEEDVYLAAQAAIDATKHNYHLFDKTDEIARRAYRAAVTINISVTDTRLAFEDCNELVTFATAACTQAADNAYKAVNNLKHVAKYAVEIVSMCTKAADRLTCHPNFDVNDESDKSTLHVLKACVSLCSRFVKDSPEQIESTSLEADEALQTAIANDYLVNE